MGCTFWGTLNPDFAGRDMAKMVNATVDIEGVSDSKRRQWRRWQSDHGDDHGSWNQLE